MSKTIKVYRAKNLKWPTILKNNLCLFSKTFQKLLINIELYKELLKYPVIVSFYFTKFLSLY